MLTTSLSIWLLVKLLLLLLLLLLSTVNICLI
jgi:hypothetical protein